MKPEEMLRKRLDKVMVKVNIKNIGLVKKYISESLDTIKDRKDRMVISSLFRLNEKEPVYSYADIAKIYSISTTKVLDILDKYIDSIGVVVAQNNNINELSRQAYASIHAMMLWSSDKAILKTNIIGLCNRFNVKTMEELLTTHHGVLKNITIEIAKEIDLWMIS